MVWIQGEISNLRTPSSGHAYFTLKDEKAQIAAVLFRSQRNQLKFDFKDGLAIVALGRISIYEPRGTYQIIIEYVEPRGAGALQLAFEQLKRKLAQEGLFDALAKKPLPFLPRTICVITSPTGAVIRDIIHVIDRRFPNVVIEILPVRVQGDGAIDQIVHAIESANQRGTADVIVLARGGGSLEDFVGFNSEQVARAVWASAIPIVSAVGHETDYTIVDFVADLRAPTPSAAAELIVPVRNELLARISDLRSRCVQAIRGIEKRCSDELQRRRRSLIHPIKRVQELRLRVDDMNERMRRMALVLVQQQRYRFRHQHYRLMRFNPLHQVQQQSKKIELLEFKLLNHLKDIIIEKKRELASRQSTLAAMNPESVLQRGYSITRSLRLNAVVTNADNVIQGELLEIVLAKGKLNVTVN